MTELGAEIRPEIRNRLLTQYLTIDGHDLRRAAQAGLAWLRANQQVVNSLNVFPVPDGDTGTNMVLTVQAAWDEIEARDDESIFEVASTLAHGALMGARGNSGVILSQLLRGFARAMDGRAYADAALLAEAFVEARDTAYKGVVRPVEGTILTVSKDIAAAAQGMAEAGETSVLHLLEVVVEAADASVKRTPELLPLLKEAGVVDSGGKGLALLLEGILRSIYHLSLEEPALAVTPLGALDLDGAIEAIEPGQDWEVVIDFAPHEILDIPSFYERLEGMGTSIQVGEGDGMYRMHIHVQDKTQYEPIEYIGGLGTITKVAIENLMVQTPVAAASAFGARPDSIQPGQIAVVAVAPGPGIALVFSELEAAAIVEGGQTMNPSTQEILAALEGLPTERVIILPNNKNVRMAAEQTAELTVKTVVVVPSVSVPQGIAAMMAYKPEGELERVAEAMRGAMGTVHSAELTTATRTVEIDGVRVREGQVIGLLDGVLVAASDDLEAGLFEVLERAEAGRAELVTLYPGADLAHARANLLADTVRERWPELGVEVVPGGQPHYHLILSIE